LEQLFRNRWAAHLAEDEAVEGRAMPFDQRTKRTPIT
jgi:hypothetical protein